MSKRDDWLKSLKVGSPVAIRSGFGDILKGTVDSITKTRICASTPSVFYRFRRDGFNGSGEVLREWTDDDETRVELVRLGNLAERVGRRLRSLEKPRPDRQSVRDLTAAIKAFLEKNK